MKNTQVKEKHSKTKNVLSCINEYSNNYFEHKHSSTATQKHTAASPQGYNSFKTIRTGSTSLHSQPR